MKLIAGRVGGGGWRGGGWRGGVGATRLLGGRAEAPDRTPRERPLASAGRAAVRLRGLRWRGGAHHSEMGSGGQDERPRRRAQEGGGGAQAGRQLAPAQGSGLRVASGRAERASRGWWEWGSRKADATQATTKAGLLTRANEDAHSLESLHNDNNNKSICSQSGVLQKKLDGVSKDARSGGGETFSPLGFTAAHNLQLDVEEELEIGFACERLGGAAEAEDAEGGWVFDRRQGGILPRFPVTSSTVDGRFRIPAASPTLRAGWRAPRLATTALRRSVCERKVVGAVREVVRRQW